MALGSAVVVLSGVLSPAAQAVPTDRPMVATTASDAPSTRTVTLITGDKVTVTPGTNGAPAAVTVHRRAGATGSVRTTTDASGTYVYPDDADAYVAQGLLDKQLFNVTALVAQGYDDEHTAGLPLLVTRTRDAGASRLAEADLPGVTVKRQLTSVRAEAVVVDHAETASLWDTLVAAEGAAARKGAEQPALPAGIDKIWLDAKLKATLADSTAQIGAPQVWNQGAIGTGVKVAVLDTGIDGGHPDLEKRVVSSRSFIADEDIDDVNGHGTHVASTIAGTGAASDGKEKGVAPGADLVIGKVLNSNGAGATSGIIAAMEWASRTEHARIISMSLGSQFAHTQDDLTSRSVNALSAETGALFVIAAGNSGPGPYTVNAPGTAAAALTVGAVDSADQIAGFSSSGPREGDEGLKPDVTAPGVRVLAARSQYAQGEGPYVTYSGTSMATPHVAGVAALLAQKHPDWTGQQLKDALMSTSKSMPDTPAYRGGTGRVDASAAFGTQIVATGAVDTGLIKFSRDPQPVERRVTYTNHGDSPVTLRLTLDRGQSPDTVFTLGADQVTVPARGSSSVNLVVDTRGLAVGGYTGQVVARDAAGAVAAHTVLHTRTEPERHDMTFVAKDRDGVPLSGWVMLRGTKDHEVRLLPVPDSGRLTLRLPGDTYSAMMYRAVRGAHGQHSQGLAVLGDPEVELTADRTVMFDATQARQMRAVTPKPSMPTNTRVEYWRSFDAARPEGNLNDWVDSIEFDTSYYDSLWVQPSPEKAKVGGFDFTTRWRAPQTPLTVSHDGADLDVIVQNGAKPLPDGTAKLDAVFAGTGTAAEYARLSAKGKAAVVRWSAAVSPSQRAQAAHAAGVKLLLVVNEQSARSNHWYGNPDGSLGPVAVASVNRDEGEALIAELSASPTRKVRLRTTAHPVPSYLYDLVSHHTGGIPQDVTYRADSRNLAQVNVTLGRGEGEQTQAMETRSDAPPYAFGYVRSFPAEPVARGERTDWVSTDGDFAWQQNVSVPGVVTETSEPVSYRSPGTHEEKWLTPIMRPRLLGKDLPVRQTGYIEFKTRAWGSNGTAHSGDGTYGQGLSQRTALYQGDTLVGESTYDYGYAWDLSPEPLPYRLVTEAANDNPSFSRYSTSTRTEWRFVSEAADGKAVPLVQLDYRVDLDDEGRARRNADLTLTPSVAGAPRTDVSSLRLEISYDDGATWHRQKTVHRGGVWKADLDAPRSASFVSLRTTAKDETGGSITQTVTRAYGLR
ncbi:S8 family serine peptidase [Streptomyces sp. NPDC001858]